MVASARCWVTFTSWSLGKAAPLYSATGGLSCRTRGAGHFGPFVKGLLCPSIAMPMALIWRGGDLPPGTGNLAPMSSRPPLLSAFVGLVATVVASAAQDRKVP